MPIRFPTYYRYEDCYFCGTNFLAAGGPDGYCVCRDCQQDHDGDLEDLFREMHRLAEGD